MIKTLLVTTLSALALVSGPLMAADATSHASAKTAKKVASAKAVKEEGQKSCCPVKKKESTDAQHEHHHDHAMGDKASSETAYEHHHADQHAEHAEHMNHGESHDHAMKH